MPHIRVPKVRRPVRASGSAAGRMRGDDSARESYPVSLYLILSYRSVKTQCDLSGGVSRNKRGSCFQEPADGLLYFSTLSARPFVSSRHLYIRRTIPGVAVLRKKPGKRKPRCYFLMYCSSAPRLSLTKRSTVIWRSYFSRSAASRAIIGEA